MYILVVKAAKRDFFLLFLFCISGNSNGVKHMAVDAKLYVNCYRQSFPNLIMWYGWKCTCTYHFGNGFIHKGQCWPISSASSSVFLKSKKKQVFRVVVLFWLHIVIIIVSAWLPCMRVNRLLARSFKSLDISGIPLLKYWLKDTLGIFVQFFWSASNTVCYYNNLYLLSLWWVLVIHSHIWLPWGKYFFWYPYLASLRPVSQVTSCMCNRQQKWWLYYTSKKVTYG